MTIVSNIIALAVGSGAARFISIASAPIITRIYSPSEYGILSVVASSVLILTPIATLQYSVAIPLPKTDAAAVNLLVLSAGIITATAGTIGVTMYLLGDFFHSIVWFQQISSWTGMLLLAVVGASLYDLLSMWATRKKAYRIVAETQIRQAISGETTKFVTGLLGMSTFGLLLGYITSLSGGVLLYTKSFWTDFRRHRRSIRPARMLILAKHYRQLPIYRLPSQILVTISNQAPILLTAMIYDQHTAGELGLATMATMLPLNLVAHSASRAFYAEAASLGRARSSDIRRLAIQLTSWLGALGLIISLPIYFFGPRIFADVFGSEWTNAGLLASYLSIMIVFQFIEVPASQMFSIYRRNDMLIYLALLRLALVTSSFGVAQALNAEMPTAILAYSVAMSLTYTTSAAVAFSIAK